MSDYVREKVVRLPVDVDKIRELYKVEDLWDLDEVPGLEDWFDFGSKEGKFHASSTGEDYIDYILEFSYGCGSGEWGRNRELTEKEKDKYEELFKIVVPWVERDKLKLVEYSWYNSCEAPDYYGFSDMDEFYEEI